METSKYALKNLLTASKMALIIIETEYMDEKYDGEATVLRCAIKEAEMFLRK